MERKKSFRGDSSERSSRGDRFGKEDAARGHRPHSDRRGGNAHQESNDGPRRSSGYRRDGDTDDRRVFKKHDAPIKRDRSNDEFETGNERRGEGGNRNRRRDHNARKEWQSYASERRSWDGGGRRFDGRDADSTEKPAFRKEYKKKTKEVTPTLADTDPDKIRLNKFIANSGVCSRRDADALIENGEITVNGKVVTSLGTIISKDDVVKHNGKKLDAERKVYILMNKAKGVVTTVDDPEDRLTVIDMVKEACTERVYPVGRLDRNTTGLLLITNDGDLAKKLTHPKHECRKIYHVFADKNIEEEHLEALAQGITLEDGPIKADKISYVDMADKSQAGVEIHSGRNRIVRRMFEHFGYHVEKLDRVYFAGLTKQGIPRGKWRFLSEKEISKLKAGFFK